MQWLVNMCNHSKLGQRSLEDVVGIFGQQLRALGHKIVWDERNNQFLHRSAGINLIVEGFNDEVVKVVADHYAAGARFICLATEEPTDKGFNHGTAREMRERQATFPKMAPYLDGILHLVPGQHVTDWYSQFAPTAYVELGYAPSLVRQQVVYEPEFDFCFFGTLSQRRLRILKKLARRIGTDKAVRVVHNFPSQTDRDKIAQNAKVIVQLRKIDQMGLVSSSRCNTALCNGRPVVAEPHDLSKPWDEIVKFAPSEESFYDFAVGIRAAWRGVHAWQFDKFKTKLTPEYCVGRALREIGILDGARRAA